MRAAHEQVLVVDDDERLAASLRRGLVYAGYDVTVVHDGPAAIAAATRRITVGSPDVAVLVLTMLEGDESVFAAMRAGARGYLLKGADRAEIHRALTSVAQGGVVFSSGVAARVLSFFAAGPAQAAAALDPFPSLTEREREVLEMVADGLTNGEIARRLVLSDKTVRNHVSNVFAKLHVTGRAEAVARARDAGLGGTR